MCKYWYCCLVMSDHVQCSEQSQWTIAAMLVYLAMCKLFVIPGTGTYCVIDRLTHGGPGAYMYSALTAFISQCYAEPYREIWALCKNYVAMNNTRQTLKTVHNKYFTADRID